MPELKSLMTGLAFGESPRWHDDRLLFSNWVAPEVIAVDAEGTSESFSASRSRHSHSLGWLPDGRLLIVSASDRPLLRREPDGSLVAHADDLSIGWNEIVVDGRGNAYINGGGFNPLAGEKFAPGIIAMVTPDGSNRQVADGLAFPNGMAVTPDNSTLIIAEPYGKKLTAFDVGTEGGLSNRRVWADLGDGVPDGICLDAEGAIWYADVPSKRCLRVREGGDVLQAIKLDRGCFACALGGADGRTLFMMAAEWGGFANMVGGPRTGQVLAAQAPAAGVGWP